MAQKQPMYQQIADELRRQIEQGTLMPDQQLPTELELREMFNASRNTIRDAIRRLIGLGLVKTKQGQGTFVVRRIDPFATRLSPDPKTGIADGEEGSTYPSMAREQNRKAEATTPKVEVLKCPADIAGRLRIKPDSPVVSRHQQRFIDGTVWSMQTSYYPMKWVTDGATRLLTAENIEEGTVNYLARTLGLRQAGYRDWVTTRTPNEEEQKLFQLSHDATVVEIFRAAFTGDKIKTAIRVTATVYPADRNKLIYDYGAVPDLSYEQDPWQEESPPGPYEEDPSDP